MKVAIASGKGGTGKTTVAAALASVWDQPVMAMDLDVEEPNLHLFLNPELGHERTATLTVPVVDEDKCSGCGLCAEICQFSAIVRLGDITMTFSHMCHGCNACFAVCPEPGALTPGERELGQVLGGQAAPGEFFMGRLRVGEAMSPPLIREVKKELARAGDVIMDAPPGVTCPAMASVRDADVIVLVTEPTPFGVWDLSLAIEAFRTFGLPMGVVINRSDGQDEQVIRLIEKEGLPCLARIPLDRDIARAYSQGRLISDLEGYQGLFADLAKDIRSLAGERKAAHA